MRPALATGLMCIVAAVGATVFAADSIELPDWVYPMNPPDWKPPTDDGIPRRVPGSDVTYSLAQLTNVRSFTGPDWHPTSHTPMPAVVAQGRRPGVFPCSYCHRADGTGGPENANLAGLPAAYIAQQMQDYRAGRRSTSVAKRGPTGNMIAVAKEITDDEIAAAAQYFSQLPRRSYIRVVESARVPRTHVDNWILLPAGGGDEPIGNRVIEFPDNVERFELRDSGMTFTAHVPPGSLARGESLVKTGGNGLTVQCATCHGPALQGTPLGPPLAGRSPNYLARQLYDFKTGARAGANAPQMHDVVARLSAADIVSITGYVASLPP